VVLLGAGAFASPALLLKSTSRAWPTGLANTSDQVGRNLMVHAHVWFAVGSDRLASPEGPLKSISLNDFYVHSAGKLGTLQSLGISMTRDTVAYYLDNQISALPPAIVRLLRPLTHPLSYVLSQPFKNAATFAGIIEDLPYRENRVMVDVSNPSEFRFEYTYPDELRARCDAFTALVRKALGARHRVLVISGKNNLDFGHVCGTVRFGNDPATSVLDASNRAHGVNNLYVVDASFFPSSGGTNLSLTIAANALRVADILAGRLDGERSL
jgi:choline dehydrogenase-like flavoprotein